MSEPASSKSHKQQSDDRLFAMSIVAALVLGVAFSVLVVLTSPRKNNGAGRTDYAVGSSKSRLISPDHPRQLVGFNLTDRTGRTMTRSDFNGKILVVDFLLTSCSLTCPTVNRQMAEIQQLTTNQPDVKLVSLTVDPRDDTPAVLAKYGQRFSADTNRWFFLTGETSVLYNLIARSFLSQDLNDPLIFMPGNFSGTERIAIVDSSGHLRGYFDGLNENTATAVADEIKKMRSQNL